MKLEFLCDSYKIKEIARLRKIDLKEINDTILLKKAEENKNLELSARNIPSVKIILPSNLNVKDLLEADSVVITESAVNDITERLQ